MPIKKFTTALASARSGDAQILLAWSPDATPALVADIFQATRSAFGRDPLVIDLHRASSGEVRQAFIRAVCTGSSVLATGLDTLDEPALDAALLGLASIHQWNKHAFGIGISKSPLALGLHRFKTIQHELPSPLAPAHRPRP